MNKISIATLSLSVLIIILLSIGANSIHSLFSLELSNNTNFSTTTAADVTANNPTNNNNSSSTSHVTNTSGANVSPQQLIAQPNYVQQIMQRPVDRTNITQMVLGNITDLGAATSTNPQQFVDGKFGKALQFHAYYEDFFMVPDSQELANPTLSVSFWLKRDPNDMNYGHVVSFQNTTLHAGWFFEIANTTSQSVRFGVMNEQGQTFTTKDISIPTDQFVHVVGVFDGSFVKIYRNGTLAGQTKFYGDYVADPKVPLNVGMASYCSSCAPAGLTIDDLRVYNRALGDNEVNAITNTTTNTTSSSTTIISGLVGYWKFDNDLKDYSGNNNNDGKVLTLVGGMASAPDGRIFFTEKNTGNIRVIMKDGKVSPEPFAKIHDVFPTIMYGLLSITVDPDFESNHYVYAYYTTMDNNKTGQAFSRIVRFTDVNDVGKDMTIIYDHIPALNGMHTGGGMAFGPDGKLYLAVGEGYTPPAAQNMTTLLGKVLRINKDGTIPSDNPFGKNSPIYALGIRNVYGLAFNSKATGSGGDGNGGGGVGILTENGDALYDQIDPLVKGANYGWPTLRPANTDPFKSINSTSVTKPIHTYKFVTAPTQAVYYDKDKFPQLKGMFLYGSYNRGEIFALQLDSTGTHAIKEIEILLPANIYFDPVVGISVASDGSIYFAGHNIYKLDAISAPISLPSTK